ncbi:MAG: hypothetical protein AB1813_18200 [Verrucomicrobiota bacterium]
MQRHEFAIVGEKRVREFMKNGEPLALRQSAAPVLDPQPTIGIWEYSAITANIMMNFLALYSNEACEDFGAIWWPLPSSCFGPRHPFPRQTPDQFPCVVFAGVGCQKRFDGLMPLDSLASAAYG